MIQQCDYVQSQTPWLGVFTFESGFAGVPVAELIPCSSGLGVPCADVLGNLLTAFGDDGVKSGFFSAAC